MNLPARRYQLLLLAFLLCLALLMVLFFWPRPAANEPDLTGLGASLQRSVEQGINAPELIDETINLAVPAAKLQNEVERVKTLAFRLGGSAILKETGTEGATLFAEVPWQNRTLFASGVRNPSMIVDARSDQSESRRARVEIQLVVQG